MKFRLLGVLLPRGVCRGERFSFEMPVSALFLSALNPPGKGGGLACHNSVGGTLSSAYLLAVTAVLFVCTAVAVGVLKWLSLLAVSAMVVIPKILPPACWRSYRRFNTVRQDCNDHLYLVRKTPCAPKTDVQPACNREIAAQPNRNDVAQVPKWKFSPAPGLRQKIQHTALPD
ncbi:hypothetical protein NDU88_009259 [Pleurodeles waltl]|uniref:Uncharacterized protein n=1 Tax=Pleurodeles waltl TaxID=8319 RepID=A0AAV7NYL6_PLEWA|nr:hypothetical protein NDU88_009259 [Pleurodeles waltl]